jgi:hypothetical protein
MSRTVGKAVFLSLMLVAMGASLSLASVRTHVVVTQPATMNIEATADQCTNHRGPYITINGVLTLGGVDAQLIFRNNVQGTHEHVEQTSVVVEIIPADAPLSFPKQPVAGGVGGNPWIWIQFLDEKNNPISGEILLGRCVQGLSDVAFGFDLLTEITTDVTSGDCNNSGGPYITLDGELVLGGLNARLIFRNALDGPHTRKDTTNVKLVIVPSGESITFAKQPPQGGVGGNPLIWLQFLDGNQEPLSSEIFLGRCVKLGD